jgi:death-on-curing family protein
MEEHQRHEIELVYLTLKDVLELYGLIVGSSSAQARDQLRNRDGLEGALARPHAYAHYENADLALQAAVLAHGIAEGQPFIDGNKRAALVAMLTFLEVNGFRARVPDGELADWIIGLSAGRTPEQLADLVRTALVAIE